MILKASKSFKTRKTEKPHGLKKSKGDESSNVLQCPGLDLEQNSKKKKEIRLACNDLYIC